MAQAGGYVGQGRPVKDTTVFRAAKTGRRGRFGGFGRTIGSCLWAAEKGALKTPPQSLLFG